jgi:hypothetical protein
LGVNPVHTICAIAWLAVPIALAWGAVAWWLGRRQETLASSQKA